MREIVFFGILFACAILGASVVGITALRHIIRARRENAEKWTRIRS